MNYSIVTDGITGKQTGVMVDMELWNYINMTSPSLGEFLADMPYSSRYNKDLRDTPGINLITGEPINLLSSKDFPVDEGGKEN